MKNLAFGKLSLILISFLMLFSIFSCDMSFNRGGGEDIPPVEEESDTGITVSLYETGYTGELPFATLKLNPGDKWPDISEMADMPEKNGYVLAGWYYQGYSDEKLDLDSMTVPAHDVSLVCIWERRQEVEVTFRDIDSSTGISTVFFTIYKGETLRESDIAKIPDTKYVSIVITHWYDSTDVNKTPIDFNTHVFNENTVLYPAWVEGEKTTVRYVVQRPQAPGNTKEITYTTDEYIGSYFNHKLSSADIDKVGRFTGYSIDNVWYLDAACTEKVPSYYLLEGELTVYGIALPNVGVFNIREEEDAYVFSFKSEAFNAGDVTIPGEWKGKKVVMGGTERVYRKYVRTLTIEEGLEVIPSGAFAGVEVFLYGIKLPSSVKTVEEGAFNQTDATPIVLGNATVKKGAVNVYSSTPKQTISVTSDAVFENNVFTFNPGNLIEGAYAELVLRVYGSNEFPAGINKDNWASGINGDKVKVSVEYYPDWNLYN